MIGKFLCIVSVVKCVRFLFSKIHYFFFKKKQPSFKNNKFWGGCCNDIFHGTESPSNIIECFDRFDEVR